MTRSRPTMRAARPALAAILCTALLAACGDVGNPLAAADPRQIDVATTGVTSCPALRPMFAAGLRDGVLRVSEINDLADRARALNDESDRADSYAEARSVAGLPAVRRATRCLTSPLMQWRTVL